MDTCVCSLFPSFEISWSDRAPTNSVSDARDRACTGQQAAAAAHGVHSRHAKPTEQHREN